MMRVLRLTILTAVLSLASVACAGDDSASPSAATPGASSLATTSPSPSSPTSSQAATCATPGPATPGGCWKQILPAGSGGYPRSPGSNNTPKWEPGKFPLTLPPRIAFREELWMTAQTVAYSSPDGLSWTEHEKTDWGSRIYHAMVYFEGRLWMFGGLEYESRAFLNDVWSSADGSTWRKEGDAAWSPRGGHTVTVYQDRLWLFGGASRTAPDRSTEGFLNDVWVSDDGLKWDLVTEQATWPPRDRAGVMVFRDELYLVGGHGQADVWRSVDGEDWTQLTALADWKPRNDYGRAVLAGKLWVFGGWAGNSRNALNDVWYSSDGIAWNRQAEQAPWAPRGPISVVFQDKIWIYSGKHTGGDDNWGGDLWQMTAVPD